MARTAYLLSTIPDAYGILFNRVIMIILSVAAIIVYALTLSIYNARIAPIGAFAPSRSSVLAVNWISLIPSIISTVLSLTHLSLLTRRFLQAHRRYARGLASTDEARETWSERKRVIHPGWLSVADGVCWAFFLAMAVLTGWHSGRWKSGLVRYGAGGATRQVNLNACPTFDSATGKIDYWCEPAWDDVVGMTSSSTGIVGTLTYVIFFVLI